MAAGPRHERPTSDERPGEAVNRVELDAVLEGRDALRYSPAGVPLLGVVLSHGSAQFEAGARREISLEVSATFAGKVAESAARLELGSKLRVRGFLARRRRDSKVLVLHVTEFELNEV